MDDNEFRLQREIRELKTEVRRLRRMIEGVFAIIGIAAIVIFPELLIVVAIGGVGFFAFLITPLGRKISPYFFHRKDDHESDA